jgi:hypothetical protein
MEIDEKIILKFSRSEDGRTIHLFKENGKRIKKFDNATEKYNYNICLTFQLPQICNSFSSIENDDGNQYGKNVVCWVDESHHIINSVKFGKAVGPLFMSSSNDSKQSLWKTLTLGATLTSKYIGNCENDCYIQLSSLDQIYITRDFERVPERILLEDEQSIIIHHLSGWLLPDLGKIVATYLTREINLDDIKIECMLKRNKFTLKYI